uniref:Uncharacterized protein n=1 Tax=Glossina austeni TaxID=7395 RepID=A0A1A9VB82_GLOAU
MFPERFFQYEAECLPFDCGHCLAHKANKNPQIEVYCKVCCYCMNNSGSNNHCGFILGEQALYGSSIRQLPCDEYVPCYKCIKRKNYEKRVARLEKEWDNFKLSAEMTTSKFIAMERRVKDLIKEKQILEQKLRDINDKMRQVQVTNNEEEWQEIDDSYAECVSSCSQDSEDSFVVSPNTIKLRHQPSIFCEERPRRHVDGNKMKAKRRKRDDGDPQTAASEEHLLLYLNCKNPRAKDRKSQQKAGECSFVRERCRRSKGARKQRKLSWDLRDTDNEKECVSPSAGEICDCEQFLSQRTNSDEKSGSEKCLVKKNDSTMEWESRRNDNDNDNDSERAYGYARKDETCDGELAKACVSPPNDETCDCEIVIRKSQQIYNEKHGAYPAKSQIYSNETKIDERGVEWKLRQARKEETSARPATTKPREYEAKTDKRGSEWELRQADNNNEEISDRPNKKQRTLKWCVPLTDSEDICAPPKVSNPCERRQEKEDQRALERKTSQFDSEDPCASPIICNARDCEGKKDQGAFEGKKEKPTLDGNEKDLWDPREREEEDGSLSQFNSDLQKMTCAAYAFKDKAKKDQRSLKWCNPLIDNEKPPGVYSARTEPCEYRAKKDQEGSEWELRQKDNDNKSTSAFCKKRYPCEHVTKEDEGKLESELPVACSERTCAYVTCAYGEEKDQRALKWDIPQADDEKQVCLDPLKTDACEYEEKKDQSSALEWELRKSSGVCSSKARTSSQCGTKPDQQPAVNDNDRDLFNTLKKEYEERFTYLKEEIRNYHASVVTGNDKINAMDQRMQTVIREKEILEQKLKQSHSGHEELDAIREHYEDRITRLEQDLHNYQLSTNAHNSKISELEKRMQCLVEEKQLLEEQVKQKVFDKEKTVLDDNKLALRPADDRDRIFELEKSMQALLKEKEFLEEELKQKECNTASNDRLKNELHDCKSIVRSAEDEITKLEERMQKLKQEKELLELAFKKKEDQLRALQEKEKCNCNDNERTQKEFDVCKQKAEAAVAQAAVLDERIKSLGQEKEFLESKLHAAEFQAPHHSSASTSNAIPSPPSPPTYLYPADFFHLCFDHANDISTYLQSICCGNQSSACATSVYRTAWDHNQLTLEQLSSYDI